MKLRRPTHKDASRTRVGDLIFEMNQQRMWAHCAQTRGRKAEAAAHRRKAAAAEKALRTLGQLP